MACCEVNHCGHLGVDTLSLQHLLVLYLLEEVEGLELDVCMVHVEALEYESNLGLALLQVARTAILLTQGVLF